MKEVITIFLINWLSGIRYPSADCSVNSQRDENRQIESYYWDYFNLWLANYGGKQKGHKPYKGNVYASLMLIYWNFSDKTPNTPERWIRTQRPKTILRSMTTSRQWVIKDRQKEYYSGFHIEEGRPWKPKKIIESWRPKRDEKLRVTAVWLT